MYTDLGWRGDRQDAATCWWVGFSWLRDWVFLSFFITGSKVMLYMIGLIDQDERSKG